MNQLFKIIALIALIFPNMLLGQSYMGDSTKPAPYIPFCNGGGSDVKKPIHLDWVQIDKDIIKNKLNPLPAIGSALTEIKKLIPNFLDGKCNCQSITQDLGYGLKSTRHTINGGYGSCHVDALYFGNDVLKLRLTIYNRTEIIEKHLLKVIQLPFDCLNRQISYEKTYPQNIANYIKDSGQVFIESADTNHRRRRAINYFTDIMTGGTFEVPFYVTVGLGKETFDHLRFFIVNKDYQALESILFSPSVTGRLFAARTLLYMQEQSGYRPAADTDKRMKDVLKHANAIASGVLSCHVGMFNYDYYDIVKDFEQFLKTE